MSRTLVVILLCFGLLVIGLFVTKMPQKQELREQVESDATLEHISTEDLPKYATFEITTLGTKRIFTDSKYHNLADHVYIDADNPARITVTKDGITWADFFATLPMELTHQCLITGTKQTYCTGNAGELKFYINGELDTRALESVIADGSHLEVIFSN